MSVSLVDGHIDPETKRRIDEATIVEALEHCIKGDCSGCPNLATEYCLMPKKFQEEVLDLINRQQAELEEARIGVKSYKGKYESAVETAKELQTLVDELRHEREVLLEDIHHSANQINEQIEEIERLTINMNAFGLGMKQGKERTDTIRAEAIKEFANRLDRKFAFCSDTQCISAKTIRKFIQDELKEMVGK